MRICTVSIVVVGFLLSATLAAEEESALERLAKKAQKLLHLTDEADLNLLATALGLKANEVRSATHLDLTPEEILNLPDFEDVDDPGVEIDDLIGGGDEKDD